VQLDEERVRHHDALLAEDVALLIRMDNLHLVDRLERVRYSRSRTALHQLHVIVNLSAETAAGANSSTPT